MLILVFVSLTIFGCSTNNSKETEVKNKKSDIEIIEEKLNAFKYNITCSEIQNLKQYSVNNNLFITNDGQLYKLSIEKVFSNETNCIKVDTNIKFARFINGSLVSADDSLYYYNNDGQVVKAIYGNESLVDIHKKIFNKYKDIYYFGYDSNRGDGIYIRQDGNKIIRIFVSDIMLNTKFKEELFGEIPEEETILGIYNNTIKTNIAYYVYGVTNQTECDRYEDVKCNYGIVKNDLASDIYDKLKYYQNGSSSIHYLDSFAIDYNNNLYKKD